MAVVAPVAGRIAYGSYSMENTVHQLSINNGCHHLHGGTGGISRQLFHVEEEEQALHFHLECRHDMDDFTGYLPRRDSGIGSVETI